MKLHFLTFAALLSCAACGGAETTTEQTTTTSTTTADGATTTAPADVPAGVPDSLKDAVAEGVAAAQTGTGAGLPKACELITEAELEKITGHAFKSGISTAHSDFVSQCGWDQKNSSEGGIGLTLHANGKEALKNSKAVKAMKLTPAAGIGDEAYWIGITPANLMVRKGERTLQIDINFSPAEKKMTEEIAKVVLAKL